MTSDTFDYNLDSIRESCYHCTTNFQRPIAVEERLLLRNNVNFNLNGQFITLLFWSSEISTSMMTADTANCAVETNNLIFQTLRAMRFFKSADIARAMHLLRTLQFFNIGFIFRGLRHARIAPHAPHSSCSTRT